MTYSWNSSSLFFFYHYTYRLISFLNGVEPLGGKSPITGKKTSFTSLKTMGAKWLGMLCSIPSGLCIGPEGPIIHISALLGMYYFLYSQ